MRGGYVGPSFLRQLLGMNRAWSAELRAGKGGISHLVVIDGVEGGNLVIRDPWAGGTTYQMTVDAFSRAWTGNAVVP